MSYLDVKDWLFIGFVISYGVFLLFTNLTGFLVYLMGICFGAWLGFRSNQ